jgi:hypothetical protein
MNELLIDNLAEIATPLGTTPRRGAEQGAVVRLRASQTPMAWNIITMPTMAIAMPTRISTRVNPAPRDGRVWFAMVNSRSR